MQELRKFCELDPNKVCDDCHKCDICDLDPSKICDSCGKCLEKEYGDYNEVKLDGVLESESDLDDYLFEIESSAECSNTLETDDINSDSEIKVEYIEDIPELKKEYDKIIKSILTGEETNELEHNHAHVHGPNCNHDHDHNND